MIKDMTAKEAFALPDPKYIELRDNVAIVFTGEHMPVVEKPVIDLPAHIALAMLEEKGLLSVVETTAKRLGRTVEIALNRAPNIHSDNLLVHSVLGEGGLGMSEAEIYQLFVDASQIKL